jgi:opine dehydrogenase
MKPVAVIGAGSSGLALAAYLATNNVAVRLWNRSESTIARLQQTKHIICTGVVSQCTRIGAPTTNIEAALDGVELVIVTTPANSHRDLAHLMAPYLSEHCVVVLSPGRTLGAVEFQNVLQLHRTGALPVIAETQTIAFTCRKVAEDAVCILALKSGIPLAVLRTRRVVDVLGKLPRCLMGFFKAAKSVAETSLGNVGMILHTAPVLLNTGWIECPSVDFKYYYDGITPSVANLLVQLDEERLQVARKLGAEVESVRDWLARVYGATGKDIFECLKQVEPYKYIDAPRSLSHRYLDEDIPTGLVPLESLGKMFNVRTPVASLVIDLARLVVNRDFRAIGRSTRNLGLSKARLLGYLR